MHQLKDNPPLKLPSLADLSSVPGTWTAAYCKPRQEKALAWDLCRQGIPYFLPMLLRETSSGGRRRRNLYPMFQSYIFFAGDDQQRLAVQKTNRVVHLVAIDPAMQGVFRGEISSLELALRKAPEEVERYPQLVTGKQVLVIGGPLKGMEGTLLNTNNLAKLWLGVTIMGSGITIEIHADLIEPLADQTERTTRGTIELPVGDSRHVIAKPKKMQFSKA